MKMVNPWVWITGVDHMLKRLGNGQRFTFGITVFIPIIPAANRHEAAGIERRDIGIVWVLLIQTAHRCKISLIPLAGIRNTLSVIENKQRLNQQGLHCGGTIDTSKRRFNGF